mgnify:CR=1 FL=1
MGMQLITIFVKPNSKRIYVKQIDPLTFEVAITSKPEKGKANKEIIEILADYFQIKKTKIQIIKGHKSRKKIVQIENN